MPRKNVKNGNINSNGANRNTATLLTNPERLKKYKAVKAKKPEPGKKKAFRPVNSGKFEHLKKFVATYRQNERAYNKVMNRKMVKEMEPQNNEPKPETVIEQVNETNPKTEIKNENDLVIEEPQKPTDEVAKESNAETMNFEDIKIDDSELDDPALDDELKQLEENMKKENEMKAMGIDPESVEEPDDPEFEQALRELMQKSDEKLEGVALEEAFQSLSKEVEGEIKGADDDTSEIYDLDVNEELKRIEEEVIAENKEKEPVAIPDPAPVAETNEIEKEDDIIVEDIKEEPEKINIVEESVRTNEIKLLGEEKVEEPVEKIELKAENTVLQSNNVNTLADDFETEKNNNEPEEIKISEEISEKHIPNNPEEKQVNTEAASFNAHELFQQIQNNVLNPQKNEKKEVVEPKTKEEPKPVYSVPPIPGMRSNFKHENTNEVPKLTKEELQAKELAIAKAEIERLKNIRTGTTQDREDRLKLINYYQGVVNKYKSPEELLKDSLELAEKARREAKEREEREKKLKELENSAKKDIIEEKKENKSLEIGNNGEELHSLRIDDFYNRLNLRMGNDDIATQVRAELTDIAKEAGITEQQSTDKFVEKTYSDMMEHVNLIYNSEVVSGTKMSIDAPSFFYVAYQSLTESDLSAPHQIIAAQKIANVMIKNYSPVAFAGTGFEHYANNYVLNNKEELETQLQGLGFVDTKAMMEEVYATLENRPIKKQETHEEEPQKQDEPGLDMVDLAGFDKVLQPMMSEADEHSNYNVFMKLAIKGILKDAGVDIGEESDPLGYADVIREAYAPEKLSREALQPMRDVAKSLFVSTYNVLTQKGINLPNKIETTQKITNEFIKRYSPAIIDDNLSKYEHNYVIGDNDLLRECLTELKLPENEIKAIVGDEKTEAKPEAKPETKPEAKPETKPISSEARVAVYEENLKTYNNMYKLDIDSNHFASSVTEAWELMTSGDKQKMADAQKVMNNLFKDTLKKAFDVEKGVAYDEHRLPEYADIIRSTNDLMRSAMYGFTDMYHNPDRKDLFAITAFGGLNAKDISELTTGNSLWSMDQKNDEAWDIQANEAKNIADKWLKEDRPYEKMINEMSALIKAHKKDNLDMKEAYNKLTAAEWLLTNNEKMMVEDPEDPLNPIPNWGNRYWKSIINAREALGIPKHTSMRDLIQLDYAESAKAVENRSYNEKQIFDGVLDPADREMHDSLDMQKEQFATMSAAVTLTKPFETNDLADDMTADRVRYPVNELDQRKLMEQEPKIYSNMVIDKENELKIDSREDFL